VASSKERQTSFAAGELSPTLHGRTDLPQFAHGAETLLNWIVTPHGSAVNRPGTIKVDRLSSGNVAFDGAELIPMETSFGPALLAFLWEYGTAGNPERRIFWRVSIYTPNAAGVFTDLNSLGGNVFFISPTLAASVGKGIEDIRVSQIGDVMTIVGFGTTMCELRRVTSTQWTLTEVTFAVEDPPTWAGKAKLEKQYQSTPFGDSAVYKFEGNSSHPAVEWQWAITRIMRDSTGRVYETKKQLVTHEYDKNGADDSLPSEVAVYPDWKQRVVWGSYGALDNNETPPDGSDILVKTRIYRGRDGTFGYLGETEGNFYVDDGSVPDFSNPPPAGENPFEVYEYDEDGDQELVRTETPRVVCHHESRRYVGATPQRGAHVWGSAVDHHKNYDRVLPADEEDALSFELAANKREDIRALISGERLLALTSAAEWLIGGAGENGLLTPLSIAARRISSFGCSKIAPAEAGDTIFFAQARGQTLRALRPGAAAGERTFDASYFAKHMLEGHDIASLAYAEEPFRVVWVVRDDGVLLSMTYVPEQAVSCARSASCPTATRTSFS
jgi:hypothetical protein